MSDEQEKEGIKIIDRRRSDSSGNERDTKSEEKESSMTDDKINKKTSAANPLETNASNKQNTAMDEMPAIGFSEFVMSFATQALMQLGAMQPPAGVNIPKDVNAAQQTIEILSMLQTKTKGNLDSSEEALIEDILHNLRIAFVKVSQGKA